MEDQPLALSEDGHRVVQTIESLVVGLDIALQLLARFLQFGDFVGPDSDAAAFQGLGGDGQGAAAPAEAQPADGLAHLAEIGRLPRQGVSGLVERRAPLGRHIQAGRVYRLEPGGR